MSFLGLVFTNSIWCGSVQNVSIWRLGFSFLIGRGEVLVKELSTVFDDLKKMNICVCCVWLSSWVIKKRGWECAWCFNQMMRLYLIQTKSIAFYFLNWPCLCVTRSGLSVFSFSTKLHRVFFSKFTLVLELYLFLQKNAFLPKNLKL